MVHYLSQTGKIRSSHSFAHISSMLYRTVSEMNMNMGITWYMQLFKINCKFSFPVILLIPQVLNNTYTLRLPYWTAQMQNIHIAESYTGQPSLRMAYNELDTTITSISFLLCFILLTSSSHTTSLPKHSSSY